MREGKKMSAAAASSAAAAAPAATAAPAAVAAATQETLVLRPTKTPKEKKRLDYKPTTFLIDEVRLDFNLNPEETVVSTRSLADTGTETVRQRQR